LILPISFARGFLWLELPGFLKIFIHRIKFQGNNMNKPAASPQLEPYAVEVEEGKTYFWCACGLSGNQPFCDGSHKQTDLNPVSFTANASGMVYLCGCKHTRNAPYCDSSHRNIAKD
jgi:CDGSH-type Zn-finger protein